jgi:hypothetical protein
MPALCIQDGFDLGKDFHGAEGFDDIFVRACFFAAFLFGDLSLCRQHDHVDIFKIGVGFYGAADFVPFMTGIMMSRKRILGRTARTCFSVSAPSLASQSL